MRRKLTVPDPPDYLSAAGKDWWTKIVSEWELDDAALLILETTLQALDRYHEAREQVTKDGPTVLDRFGQVKPHPALLTERDSRTAVLRGIKSLGLDLEPLADRPGRQGR